MMDIVPQGLWSLITIFFLYDSVQRLDHNEDKCRDYTLSPKASASAMGFHICLHFKLLKF